MFGLNVKFYLKTITFNDTISAVGLLSTKQSLWNKAKLLFSILVSALATVVAVDYLSPFATRSSDKLLNTYLSLSGFSGLLCSAVLVIKLAFGSAKKKRNLLEAEFVRLRVEKHSIAVCQSAALDFSKEVLFLMQCLHVVLYVLLHGISIYYIVAEKEFDKFQVLPQIASMFLFIFHASMYYSFTMLNLVGLETFLKIGEEILATAHPKNLTLSINKVLSPVDQIGDSIFTVRPQPCFKDIRSKQIRSIIKDYCWLEYIRTFTHLWHSGPLTCMLTAEATYIPTLPMNKPSDNAWRVFPGIPNQFILIVLLLTALVSIIASNVYYSHSKDKLRNSLNRYFYGTREVQVQRQLMNFKLLLGSDEGARHWKWHAIDYSLLGTIFDTSVLIFTTFLAEIM